MNEKSPFTTNDQNPFGQPQQTPEDFQVKVERDDRLRDKFRKKLGMKAAEQTISLKYDNPTASELDERLAKAEGSWKNKAAKGFGKLVGLGGEDSALQIRSQEVVDLTERKTQLDATGTAQTSTVTVQRGDRMTPKPFIADRNPYAPPSTENPFAPKSEQTYSSSYIDSKNPIVDPYVAYPTTPQAPNTLQNPGFNPFK